MLIRYKEHMINLTHIIDIWGKSVPIDGYNKYIIFFGVGHADKDVYWGFDSEQERDKVYKYIVSTYFTDIKQLMNDSPNFEEEIK